MALAILTGSRSGAGRLKAGLGMDRTEVALSTEFMRESGGRAPYIEWLEYTGAV